MQTSGNVLLYLAVKGMIMPPYIVMLLISMMACNSQTWFEVASLVTCVRNFETERCAVPRASLAMPALRDPQSGAPARCLDFVQSLIEQQSAGAQSLAS